MTGSLPIGIITSNVNPTRTPWNAWGVTPTIVNGCPSSVTVCPSTEGAPPVLALPEPVRDDCDRAVGSAAAVVVFGEGAADDGGDAQPVEEPAAHIEAWDDAGFAGRVEVEPREADGHGLLQDIALAAQ